jgi:hypothetical protein
MMSSSRTTSNNSNNNNNNHRRQWSESVMSTDKSNRLYKGKIFLRKLNVYVCSSSFEDDDRQLIQHLVNEYLLEGSNDVLDLIRNCPIECFEVFIFKKQTNQLI